MKPILKTVGRAIRRYAPRWARPSVRIAQLVRRRTNNRVISGPFAGMRYVNSSLGSVYIPKLLGIYERELTDVLEAALSRRPSVVVDVGAAEGYYAVGVARRLAEGGVIAFEGKAEGRRLIQEMADLNGVLAKIDIRGWCDPDSLRQVLRGSLNPLLIIDVEGYEDVLLDPDRVPELSRTEIVAELHDFISEGVTERVVQRLSPSHQIVRIDQKSRSRRDFPFTSIYLRVLPKRYADRAVSEWRPVPMHWIHCVPRA